MSASTMSSPAMPSPIMPASTLSSPSGRTPAVKDADGNLATAYGDMVHSGSSDSQATLPANYTFSVSGGGVHTLVNAVVPGKKGKQTLAVTDAQNSALAATDSISVV